MPSLSCPPEKLQREKPVLYRGERKGEIEPLLESAQPPLGAGVFSTAARPGPAMASVPCEVRLQAGPAWPLPSQVQQA